MRDPADATVKRTLKSIDILKADGLQHRKGIVAPGITNQEWPDLAGAAEGLIIRNALRLVNLEQLVYSNELYLSRVREQYERMIEEKIIP